MIETKDYYLEDDTILFKYYFDKEMDDYYPIINNCQKLIFNGNKYYYKLCIKFNDICNIKLCNKYLGCSFSHFNKQLILHENITHLFLSDYFNRKIDLTNNIIFLMVGYDFNQCVILPNNIKYLLFEYNFNKHIIFPKNIIILRINCNFSQKSFLPNLLNFILFDENLNLHNNRLTNNITTIYHEHYCNYIKILPNSVIKITYLYGELFNKKQQKINKNITFEKINVNLY